MHKLEVHYNRNMNKLLIVFITLSCYATTLHADDPKKYEPNAYSRAKIGNDFQKNKAFLEKDLQVNDDDIVSLGRSEREFQKLRNDLIPLPKIDRSQEENPYPPYRALIKRGVRLYSLDLEEVFIASRDVIAMANEIIKGGSLAFIFNNEGKSKYIAVSREIEKIEEHFELEKKLDAKIEYRREYKHKVQDYELKLEHSLNFHIEDIKAVFFAEIFNGTSTGARANRVSYRLFFPWEFPIDFGLSTSFQDGSYDNFENNQIADWNAVYVGPYIRTVIDKSESYRLLANVGIEKSVYFDVAESFQMSTNLWAAGIELETKFGNELFLFSLGYRSLRGHIKRSIIGEIEENTTRRKIRSIDFSIGYRFGQFL